MSRRVLLVCAVALLACAVVAVAQDFDEAVAEGEDAILLEVETLTEVEAERHHRHHHHRHRDDDLPPGIVRPIVDNTGHLSGIPRANLKRFHVRPKIDKTLLQDSELAAARAAKEQKRLIREQAWHAKYYKDPVAPAAPLAPVVPFVGGLLPPTPRTPNATLSLPKVGSSITGAITGAIGGAVKAMIGFAEWTAKHGKVYASPTETALRASKFEDNKKRVQTLNAAKDGAEYDIDNPFADLDEQEFATLHLTFRPGVVPAAAALLESAFQVSDSHPGDVFFETEMDLNTMDHEALTAFVEAQSEEHAMVEAGEINFSKYCSPIKNQGSCGSCWAHATVEVLECAWRKAGHGAVVLSPQQLVDCNKNGNRGCNGGDYMNAFAYLESHGSALLSQYPYTARNGNCRQASGKGPRVKTAGLAVPQCMGGACSGQKESAIPAQLQKYGPLGMIMDASKLQHYKKGIISPASGCKSSWNSLNHAVVIVGYNPGQKSWLVRNSWSSQWGENGYFRLAYGHNTCGLADYVAYITV